MSIKTHLFLLLVFVVVSACDAKKIANEPVFPSADISLDAPSSALFKSSQGNFDCGLATAGFNATEGNSYEVFLEDFPATRVLSKKRNYGFAQGGVVLTPMGLQINEPGNYRAHFFALIKNQQPDSGFILPLFLVGGNVVDTSNFTSQIPAFGSVDPLETTQISATGLLTNVPARSSYSIVVSNGGSPQTEPLIILAWGISVYKTCEAKSSTRESPALLQ